MILDYFKLESGYLGCWFYMSYVVFLETNQTMGACFLGHKNLVKRFDLLFDWIRLPINHEESYAMFSNYSPHVPFLSYQII